MTATTLFDAPRRWWHRQLATLAVRRARRLIARNADLLTFGRVIRKAMTDRGECRSCHTGHALRADGRVRVHGGCPGGDQLPAPITVTTWRTA